jgi:hypothetical protein
VGGTRSAGPGGAAEVDAPSESPTRLAGRADAYLREREQTENFPVALRVLPRDHRRHLAAVYDVARVIDDLGDDAPGDRRALLRGFADDLRTIWDGGWPRAPVLRRLAGTVTACHLGPQPFLDLIEANVHDQEVTEYPTFADLIDYCALSANPVGRIVLAVFGAETPDRVALSDRICTALQIIEHCQDVVTGSGSGPPTSTPGRRAPDCAGWSPSRRAGPPCCSTPACRCCGSCGAGPGWRSAGTPPAAGRPSRRCGAPTGMS